jgi:hypothetical protein
LKFCFYDALGAQIGSGPFVVDVNQSAATRDWYADTNAVGSLLLPFARRIGSYGHVELIT